MNAAVVRGEILAIAELNAPSRAQMLELLARSFDNASQALFDSDLANKQYAIVLRDAGGVIRGFTTLAIEVVEPGLSALYSGDTIVDRASWGSPLLARTWIASVRTLRDRLGGELVWLLICSGPRTYRFLPLFFSDFYPRFDHPTPEAIRGRMQALASRRYGEAYDGERGVVVFASPQPLRSSLLEVPLRQDSHVAYFERCNPGYVRGDELVCYCPLSDSNLSPAGRRMAGLGARLSASESAQ